MKITPNFFRIDKNLKKLNQVGDNREIIKTRLKIAHEDKNPPIDDEIDISALITWATEMRVNYYDLKTVQI